MPPPKRRDPREPERGLSEALRLYGELSSLPKSCPVTPETLYLSRFEETIDRLAVRVFIIAGSIP